MTPDHAHKIMMEAHAGQVDKSGMPYHTHPERVEDLLTDAPHYVRVAALLHDVVEDTALTPEKLLVMGVSTESVAIIHRLTRREDETYGQYIDRVIASNDLWTMKVKLADLTDNMSRPLPPKLAGLHRRYAKAMTAILAALDRMS